MLQSSGSVPTVVGRDAVNFLRALYPRDTAKNVARDIGVQVGTIEKMLERQSNPSWGLGIAMMLHYGPDFIAAVSPHAPAWLSRAVRAERLARMEARAEALAREIRSLRG